MPRFSRARDNGWTKFFADGTKLQGLDRDIPSGRCSWSRSRLNGMTGCQLKHDGFTIELRGIGKYHQSDDMEVTMELNQTVKPRWATRRIQKWLAPSDKYLIVRQPTRHHYVVEATWELPSKVDWIHIETVDETYRGGWITVELNVDTMVPTWMIKERI